MKLTQAEAKLTKAYRDYFANQKTQQAAERRMNDLECKVADLSGDVAQCIRRAKQKEAN